MGTSSPRSPRGWSGSSRTTTVSILRRSRPLTRKISSSRSSEGFTKVEQTLIEFGKAAEVSRFRRAFQDVMAPRFKAVVEEATGRKVVGFMSGDQNDPNMLGEIFVLEPRRR